MIPSSTTLRAAARAPFARPRARAELLNPSDQVIATLDVVDGSTSWRIAGGTVTCEQTLTVVDRLGELGTTEEEILRTAVYGREGDVYGNLGGTYGVYSQTIQTGVLLPLGNRLRIYSGFHLLDGLTELLLVGTFRVLDAAWASDGTIRLTLPDMSDLISANKWTLDTLEIPKDTLRGDAARMIIQDRMPPFWKPKIALHLNTGSTRTPKLDFGGSPGGDPWNDACVQARLDQQLLYFDRYGNIKMVPLPDPTTGTAAFTISSGPGGNLVDVTVSSLGSQTYNRTIVTGSGGTQTGDPVQGMAQDDLPGSPSAITEPIGIRTRTISTSVITSAADAQNLANVTDLEARAVYEEVTVSFLPAPHLEATDLVRLYYPEGGLDYTYAMTALSMPSGGLGLATATLRRRRDPGDY